MGIVVKRLVHRLPAITAELRPKASAVVKKTTFDIEGDGKQRAPIKDGGLRGSIQGLMVNDLRGEVTVGVAYGARIEFGFNGDDSLGRTYHQAAQPYLTPASETAAGPFYHAMGAIFA